MIWSALCGASPGDCVGEILITPPTLGLKFVQRAQPLSSFNISQKVRLLLQKKIFFI